MDYYANNDWRNHLSHYGIHGQKWHRRRFQNLDDSLTPEGRKRYPPLPDYVRYARIAEENRKRNPYKKLLKDFETKEIDDFQTKEIKKLFKKDGFEFTGDMGELREYLKTHSAATYKEILKEFEPEKDEKDKQKPEDEDIETVEDPIGIEPIDENKKQLKHQLIEGSLDLYHHGIEGQKWGVQNGPPYPLDRETHNRVVAGDRTAGSALSNYSDTDREEQFSSANNPGYVRTLTSPIKGTDNWKTEFSWRNDPSAGGIGLSATAAVREEAARNGFYFEKNFWYSDDSIGYLRDNIRSVNKGFGEVEGCTNNCTKCTFVCELYKRGFKGYQAGRLEYGAHSDALAYWFKDATFERGTVDDIDRKINSYGDRSSGALDLRLQGDTGGHSIHYIKEHGKFSINEGQSGKTYEANTFKEALGKYIESHPWFDIEKQPVGITRLDNCDVDWDHAIEDSCIRGDSVFNRQYRSTRDRY